MSILKRLGNALKANLNDMLDKMEDKAKMLELTLFELEEQKNKLKRMLIENYHNQEIKNIITNDLKKIENIIKQLKLDQITALSKEAIEGEKSFDDFNRMEEKIKNLENEIEAMGEMIKGKQDPLSNDQEVTKIDEELERIKRNLKK